MIKEEVKEYLNDIKEDDLSPKFKAQFEEKPAAPQPAKEVYLDSLSSISDIKFAARYLGEELSEDDAEKVYDAVMAICAKKEQISASEFVSVIRANAKQVPETYQLQSYMVSSGNKVLAVASVSILRDGFEYSAVAGGGGPIDAAFNAIDKSLGLHFILDNFTIQAVTEGKESLGLASVTLRKGDKVFTGNGISTDIVESSINAYINAINRIFCEEG